ncbi:MAG: peptidylprolyl isomerase [Clostridiales bacterium]|nr:peptidylprolyl isomerase [Clostridiales bacterium]
MSKNLFRVLCALLSVLFLFSCVSCSRKGEKLLESSKAEKTPVMKVGGFDVPMELYRYLALNYKRDFESGASPDIWLGDSGAALLEDLHGSVTDTLAYLYATVSLADEYGIHPDDPFVTDTVDRQMKAVYEEYGYDYEAYLEYLRSYNMNDSVYRFFVRNDVLAEELVVAMEKRGEIATDDAALKKILAGDEVVRVKQILVTADGMTDEEAEAKAALLLDRVRAGEDFDTLVQKESRDLFMFNNPDGYYISRGTYHREFEDAAFALAVGETSGVIRTDAGWSILKRYEKEQSYLDEHFDDLADEYIAGQYNMRLEEREQALLAEGIEKLPALEDYPVFNLEATY